MKNRFLLLLNKLWQKQRLFVQKLNHSVNNFKPIAWDCQHRRMSFRSKAIAGIIIFIVTALSVTALSVTSNPLSNISYKTSWIGNTFGGGSKWVQIQISAMYVASDGTVYTNSVWDEAGREAGIYQDGDAIAKASNLHGWGRTGGEAVTANSKYLYIAMTQGEIGYIVPQDYPSSGTDWYCVRRYNLSGEPAPFAGGRGYDQSMLVVSTSGPVTGLANAGGELYVSDRAANRIRVYNTETLTELRSWPSDRPKQIAVDAQSNLWILQAKDASNPPQILHYSKTGTLLSQKITDVVDPTALAIDPQGRLLVAENGPRQQVLIYDISPTPKLIGTFGTPGGIYSGTKGEVAELKLNGLTGVGADKAGNIYVSNDGFGGSGTDLRKFSPLGKMQWQLLGLQFVDNADADPGTDGLDVFTKHEHFVMDYSKENGQEWSYKAYTLDKFRYPDDPRLHNETHSAASVFVRRIGGKRFLYLTGMFAHQISVYRFDGEIAVPCAIFARDHSTWPTNQPATGSWLWHDKNGDGSIQSNEYESLGAEDDSIWGWEVDSNGDVWQASESGAIGHYPVQGLDTYGTPIYHAATAQKMPMPAPFKSLTRIKYFPETDTMYLTGYTNERPNIKGSGIVGTEIIRYDNWSKSRNIRWRVALPYQPSDHPDPSAKHFVIIKAMDIAGDRIFATSVLQAEVYVYDTATGAAIAKLKPGIEVAGESGWVDIPYGLRAYQRTNGEYLVFVEEDAKAKVIMYRLGQR
ncbi:MULTISPECIES: hypothetical protein [unclassified Microcoleus]|uniref:hypothetical protein n=1 Tax=unclassified Microcoleus TaxID=2642155 RepID=UPI002FCFA71E